MAVETPEKPVADAPKLGDTAHEVWWAWKQEQYMAGQACFGRSPALGELSWQIDGLNRVIGPHLVQKLTPEQEDVAWADLVAGRLRIYRRANAPLLGASMEPTRILHEATGRRIPSGLSGDD